MSEIIKNKALADKFDKAVSELSAILASKEFKKEYDRLNKLMEEGIDYSNEEEFNYLATFNLDNLTSSIEMMVMDLQD